MKKITRNLVKYIKLIKIADITVTGWNTVHGYLSDGLVKMINNCEDDKKLKSAEARVIKKHARKISTSKKGKNHSKNYFNNVSSFFTSMPMSYQQEQPAFAPKVFPPSSFEL